MKKFSINLLSAYIYQRGIKYFSIMIILMITGCSSNQAVSYRDNSSDSRVVINLASQYQQWKYTPYRYGGNTAKGIDCSGLVVNTFQSKFKMTLPRTTTQQAKLGYEVSSLQAGDLVFFKTGRGGNGLHVGIYYKNGQFLHVSTKRGVELASLDNSYWKSNYWMTRRVL